MDEAQQRAVEQVLRETEGDTLASVQVVVDEDPEWDLDAAALEQWRALDLDDVGVLVLVGLGRREIRVVAGPRLLAETDDAYWQAAADAIAVGFRDGDPAAGFRRALSPVAELLRRVAQAP